jgi:hypothetical protein
VDDLKKATFEVFTLGTLAVIIGVAVVGYVWRRLRDSSGRAAATTEVAPEAHL